MTQPLKFEPNPGESAGDFIWRILTFVAGTSLHNHPEILEALAAVDETRPGLEMQRTTNCATSRRWVDGAAGVDHPFAHLPDEKLRAIHPEGPVAWVLDYCRDLGALIQVTDSNRAGVLANLGPGWIIHYATPGYSNDHIETCGPRGDKAPLYFHGGGGRGDNAITISKVAEDITKSRGRPIAHVADPNKLLPHLTGALPAPRAEEIIPPPSPASEIPPKIPFAAPTPGTKDTTVIVGAVVSALIALGAAWAQGCGK